MSKVLEYIKCMIFEIIFIMVSIYTLYFEHAMIKRVGSLPLKVLITINLTVSVIIFIILSLRITYFIKNRDVTLILVPIIVRFLIMSLDMFAITMDSLPIMHLVKLFLLNGLMILIFMIDVNIWTEWGE